MSYFRIVRWRYFCCVVVSIFLLCRSFTPLIQTFVESVFRDLTDGKLLKLCFDRSIDWSFNWSIFIVIGFPLFWVIFSYLKTLRKCITQFLKHVGNFSFNYQVLLKWPTLALDSRVHLQSYCRMTHKPYFLISWTGTKSIIYVIIIYILIILDYAPVFNHNLITWTFSRLSEIKISYVR